MKKLFYFVVLTICLNYNYVFSQTDSLLISNDSVPKITMDDVYVTSIYDEIKGKTFITDITESSMIPYASPRVLKKKTLEKVKQKAVEHNAPYIFIVKEEFNQAPFNNYTYSCKLYR